MTRLVALVVTYNRLDQLQRTVRRLLEAPVDLVVVDNASTDGTGAWLQGLGERRLTLVTLAENSGGAGGFEAGLRLVRDRFDPDWCVLMDDDARPLPGALAAFAARSDEIAQAGLEAVAAGVFYPDGRICDMNRPWRNPFWHLGDFLKTLGGGRAGFHVDDAAYRPVAADRAVIIDGTSFVGFFLSRAGLARAGLPDGALFIYADDVIYTLGLSRRGGRIGFLPDIAFEHECSTYQAGGGDIYHPLWKVYYNYRNSLMAYRIAAGPVFFWPVLSLAAVKWRLRARGAGPARGAYLALYRLALRDALAGRRARSHANILEIAAGEG